jgi:YD repeat-containing protein
VIGLIPIRVGRAEVMRQVAVITTVDPTIIDDGDDGYRVGMTWLNTLTQVVYTLMDATPGAAVWVATSGGGSGGPLALGGDLGGTTAAGYAKTVRGVSFTLTYDGNGRLATLTSALGSKSFTYDGNGKLTNIIGTGQYRSKVLTYSGDQLADVAVA